MRKKIETVSTKSELNENTIRYLIKSYFHNNLKLNEFKKQVDKEKDTIKDYYIKQDITELQSDDILCTVTKSDRATLNEVAAIDVLKKLDIDKKLLANIIKTKEYIDEDALENAIYNKQINGNFLNSCIEHKDVYTLRIKKIGKE